MKKIISLMTIFFALTAQGAHRHLQAEDIPPLELGPSSASAAAPGRPQTPSLHSHSRHRRHAVGYHASPNLLPVEGSPSSPVVTRSYQPVVVMESYHDESLPASPSQLSSSSSGSSSENSPQLRSINGRARKHRTAQQSAESNLQKAERNLQERGLLAPKRVFKAAEPAPIAVYQKEYNSKAQAEADGWNFSDENRFKDGERVVAPIETSGKIVYVPGQILYAIHKASYESSHNPPVQYALTGEHFLASSEKYEPSALGKHALAVKLWQDNLKRAREIK